MSTKAQLITEIGTAFPDNTTGLITPLVMRTTTGDFVNSWQQSPAVNAQSGTTYTVTPADYGQLVLLNNASPVAVSLPAANSTNFTVFNVLFKNNGVGLVIITPQAGTIDGGVNLTLSQNQSAYLVSDGLNWRSGILSSAGGGTIVLNGTPITGGGTRGNFLTHGSSADVVSEATAAQVTAAIGVFTPTLQGVVPGSGGGTSNFLCADGTWKTTPTAALFTSTTSGIVSGSGGGTVNFLRADGSWVAPPTGSGGGGLPAGSGNAGAPGVNFISDTASGMYLANTSVLGFSAGGVQRLRIQTGVIVGTGTTDPGAGNLLVGGMTQTTTLGMNTATPRNAEFVTSDANTVAMTAVAQFQVNIRNSSATANNWMIQAFYPASGYGPVYSIAVQTTNHATPTGRMVFLDAAGAGALTLNAASTASSSPTTGTAVVTGGLGVSGSVYAGGPFVGANGSTNGIAFGNNTTGAPDAKIWEGAQLIIQAGSSNTMSWVDAGNVGTYMQFTGPAASGNLNVAMTTASSSPSSGAFTVAGGVGVGGSVYAAQGAFGFTGATANPLRINQASTGQYAINCTVVNSAGSSGLSMAAGTSATDTCAQFLSAASAALLVVRGDGGVVVGNPTGGTKGIGTVNVQNGYYINGALFGSVADSGAAEPIGTVLNYSISVSAASNNLTITINDKDGSAPSTSSVILANFRSTTLTNGTSIQRSSNSALTFTIGATATMGTTSNVPFKLHLVLFDNAGTLVLGAILCTSGANAQLLTTIDISNLQSTPASANGGSTAGIYYAAVASLSLKAIAYLGYLECNLTSFTAGQWGTSGTGLITRVVKYYPGMKMPGDVVQALYKQNTTYANASTSFPNVTTVPLISYGDEWLNQPITPTSVANKLVLDSQVNGTTNGTGVAQSALFQDANTNGLAQTGLQITNANQSIQLVLHYEMVAAMVSSTTFRIRAGSNSGQAFYLNGQSAAALGTVQSTYLRVQEIAA